MKGEMKRKPNAGIPTQKEKTNNIRKFSTEIYHETGVS
jgi:hypothetical protein